MVWEKGVSPNPGGRAKRDAAILRRLDTLTLKAVDAYAKILSDDDATNSERLQAANAVLDRVLGKPKQQIQSNVTVEHGPTAQLAALMGLSRSALTIDHEPPKLLNSLDNQPIVDVNDRGIIGK
jgi:hypothetical protein